MVRSTTMLNFTVDHDCDVAVVGGGPAGLMASVYLARFLRSVVVFDTGDARAELIPRTHNCPGFPEGISGKELLERLRCQAKTYGVRIVHARVEAIERRNGPFIVQTTSGTLAVSSVILATGIVDRAPPIIGLREGIAAGSVRLCPVCDAYEARGKRIGVVGPEELALKEALFLQDYAEHVSILSSQLRDVSSATRMEASAAGIEILDAVDNVIATPAGLQVIRAEGMPDCRIDVLYPAMGSDVRSELATNLGADCDEEGYILVGSHAETSVSGLYAIGDVAKALNQIVVGFGQAALAAAHIHNTLRETRASARTKEPA